jgi:hypothetical protein
MNGTTLETKTTQQCTDEDALHWKAVDIILDRFKEVSGPDVARIAEAVTAEAVPTGLSEEAIRRLLSKRITAEVRGMGDKAPKPVGRDRLVTVGAKRQDHSGFADTFNNTTEGDSNYGDLTDHQLSTRYLEQNERQLPEQERAKAKFEHIKRGVSARCRGIFDAILAQGGPGEGDTTNSIAEAIGSDHKTVERCFAEAQKAVDWKIFGTPNPPLKPENPQKLYKDITAMAEGIAEEFRRGPAPLSMETIRATLGGPAVTVFEDKRTNVGRNFPPPPKARKAPVSNVDKLKRKARSLSKRWDKHIAGQALAATECEVCKGYMAEMKRLDREIRAENEAGRRKAEPGKPDHQIPATFICLYINRLDTHTGYSEPSLGQ